MGKRFLRRESQGVSIGRRPAGSDNPNHASGALCRAISAPNFSVVLEEKHMVSESSRLLLGGMRAALLILLAVCVAPLTGPSTVLKER